MYDILIIGGGISGLYFLYKFKDFHRKIGLLEKANHLGGKLRTVYNNDQMILYETGPWRVSPDHHRMITLCQELGIRLHKIEKNINIYIHESTETESIEIIDNKKDPGLSVYDNFVYNENKNYADFIDSKTGYNEILDMNSTINAYDAKNKKEVYYVPEQGFSGIIKKLSEKIKDDYDLFLNTFVQDISYNGDYYTISTIIRKGSNRFAPKIFKSRKMIIACPLSSFKQWRIVKHFDVLLSSVSTYPLNHIYALCKEKPMYKGNTSFFIITENPLSQIISSNYDNHWIQISYSGGKMADFWNRLYKSHKMNWKKKIIHEFQKIIKNCQVLQLKMYYWSDAIHMWNPCVGFHLDRMYKLSLYPDPVSLKDFFIIGETFSKNQGWCEGALETVEDLYKIFCGNYFVNLLDVSNIPYVIYKNRVLNVKNWIPVHPGGQQPIENHLYEDISFLWETIHSTDHAKNHIICLQIGWKFKNKFYHI